MAKTSLVIINRSASNPIGRRRNFALLFLLGAAVLGGCGKRISVPSTVPVSGVVKYKGKPLQGIRVTLHPQAETAKSEFIPTGQTGPDGKFYPQHRRTRQRSAARNLRRDV